MTPYSGLKLDPITGREIAQPCWNGTHEDPDVGREGECEEYLCGCGCHDPIPTPILAD
jgi:hypothetical protein